MEITNEVKAKVMAQYLGHWCQTKTRQTQGAGLPSKYLKGVLKEIDLGMSNSFMGILLENETDINNHINYNTDQCKLILKPLSQMSNEHNIEIGKLAHYGDVQPSNKEWLLLGKRAITELFINNVHAGYSMRTNFFIHQYLIAKGYDLPNYLLNRKTLHEAGLAIYE